MEINRFTFQPMLKSLLVDISTAHFIALDFEFSGIHKQAHRSTKTPNSGKQTLQERYLETKAAAETYQVLQVGLTFVFEDLERGSYEVKPYNFNLSPLMTEKGFEIDRDIVLQGSAVDFLLQNSFQIEVPFREGIPYLSRQEEALARDIAVKRMDRSKIADIDIKSSDVDALAFVKTLRDKIKSWKVQPEAGKDQFLNISNRTQSSSSIPGGALNAFQRRLVYQTLRSDFPDLVAISKPTFMQIKSLDVKEEASIQAARLTSTSEKITRQVGLRWLFEAMVGGSLSTLDPLMLVPRPPEGEAVLIDSAAEAASFVALQEVLRTHRTVLVGHNFFTDLIYMYATFFGPLPETYNGFSDEIHKLFPKIVDTKYVATADRGGEGGAPRNPFQWASSLEELDDVLRAQETPIINTHPDHLKYEMQASLHEAGYDSFLTAKILIRLSANLQQQQTERSSERKKSLTATSTVTSTANSTTALERSESDEGGVKLPNGKGEENEDIGSSTSATVREGKNMMPSLDSSFWGIYGNRIRVNGTQEGSMDLNDSW